MPERNRPPRSEEMVDFLTGPALHRAVEAVAKSKRLRCAVAFWGNGAEDLIGAFEQRNIMQTIQHPTVGAFKMVGWPVRFSGNPPPVKPAPLLGANTEEVLTHWLGLDKDAVGGLKNNGVIG